MSAGPLWLASLCLIGLLSARGAGAAAAAYGEATKEQLKAAMLFQVARFVEWPATRSGGGPSVPLVIAVVDADAIGQHLSQIVEAQTIAGRPVVVKRLRRAGDLTGPFDLLFIGAARDEAIPGLLRSLGGAAVLTVSDSHDFVRRGGIIAFREDRDRIAFDVSLANARRANLRISSRLLSLAKTVVGRSEEVDP